MGSTIDGLASGLNTSDLISQLMQVEAIPQQKLKAKVGSQTVLQGALQSINTKMKSLLTAGEALTKPEAFSIAKATSSSDAVTATAGATSTTGQLTFAVEKLAKAQVSTAKYAAADTPAIDTTIGLSIKIGSGADVPITVAADKNTPQGIADAINAAGLDVKAVAVDTGSGLVLQLTSAKTGTASGFTVTGLTVADNVISAADDAKINVGPPGNPGSYSVTSASNSFTKLIPGVTLTATKVAAEVTVGVTRDVDGIAGKIQALIDTANGALSDISSKSQSSVASAPLKGNFLVRQAATSILSSVGAGYTSTVDGVSTQSSFATAGVQLDKTGRLTFDRAAFTTAYAKDPVGVQKMVTEGLATALKGVADSASNVNTGTITQVLKNGESYTKRLNDEINGWDNRLQLRQKALQRQYSGLEVALSKMKSQSSWLSGQIASLG